MAERRGACPNEHGSDCWIECWSPGGPCPPGRTVCQSCGPCLQCAPRVYVLAPTYARYQDWRHAAWRGPRHAVYVRDPMMVRGLFRPVIVDLGYPQDWGAGEIHDWLAIAKIGEFEVRKVEA